jgi:hypothetical protein
MRPSASELENTTTRPAASRRPARAPFFVYGAVHGAFVDSGLAWRRMARAIARRYLVTFLAVGVVGLLLAMVVMDFDS